MRHLVTTSYGQILRAASVVAPHNRKLIKHRSKWLRSRGDAGRALALIDRALTAAPRNERLLRERVRVIDELAEMRWAAGDADGASALIAQILAIASQDAWLIRKRAEIYARFAKKRRAEGDAAGALKLIDDALVSWPDDPGLLVARASTLHALRRYQNAIDVWRRLAARAPFDGRPWVGMASALYMTERPEETDSLIEAYLRVLGERPDRYVRAARVAFAGRRAATFESLLARARTDAHRNAVSLRELAHLLVEAGRAGEALNCLDEALKLDRQNKVVRTRYQKTLRALRLAGIDARGLPPQQRAALRMPDLALLALLNRAHSITRRTTGKVVMVYTTLGPGGAERQLANTVRGFGDLARPPEVVLMPTLDDDPEIHRFHVGPLDALQVPIEPYDRGNVDLSLLRSALGPGAEDLFSLLPVALRQQIAALTSRFLGHPPAVVHAWSDHRNITAGIAAVLAGVPRIVLSTRSVAPPGTRTVPTYFREIYRALLDRPSVVLVNNSAAGARTYAEWLGVDATHVRVLYNGVDIVGLEQARNPRTTGAHRARLGLPAAARVVGSVFRLGRVKRPLLWLEAAAEVARRCSEAHFVIVGEGPLRDAMATAAAGLGIADRLHMPGLTRDVAPWYDLMDVVLLTSEREGTSNTALEAQALGKPVVSPAVGGMPETFLPGTSGLLVSPEPGPAEIADCVTRALMDTAWREQAEQAARSFVRERFSIERMIGDTLDLYGLKSASAARNRHEAADCIEVSGACADRIGG